MVFALEQPVTPSEEDVNLAKQSSRSLTALGGQKVTCRIKSAKGEPVEIELPMAAVRMLTQMLTQMAEGKAVVLMPINAQLTTQQAADLLGVSRPFLVEQMKSGQLAFQKVGTHRRIAYVELMRYREKMAAESQEAMNSLAAEAQELKLGYE